MHELKIHLEQLKNLTEVEIDIYSSLFSEQRLNKNEYFAKEGEYSTKFAFLTKGVMRAFYRTNEGREYNKTFFTNSNMFGAYSSLVTGQENIINIQCLTDCTVQAADYGEYTKLFDEYPKIERLARKFAETMFSVKEKREIELVTLDASERYKIFLREYPNLENLIPQYHIASYLGITPTQLSRIRAKKQNLYICI